MSSMTGFARASDAYEDVSWAWEIRSVNGKGLETRIRVPSGFEDLELRLKRAVAKKLSRGSINASLSVQGGKGMSRLEVNEAALDAVLAALDQLALKRDFEKPRADGVLNIRGVIDIVDREADEDERAALAQAICDSFERTVSDLQSARKAEGVAIFEMISTQLDEIQKLTAEASTLADATPKAIRERINAQLKELLADSTIAPERLEQEAAMMALKADIREELDRLNAHVEAARALLAGEGPHGRKLDFLTQEFNREANTLCSKAATMPIKQRGLALKSVIDQMREQVQNVE